MSAISTAAKATRASWASSGVSYTRFADVSSIHSMVGLYVEKYSEANDLMSLVVKLSKPRR